MTSIDRFPVTGVLCCLFALPSLVGGTEAATIGVVPDLPLQQDSQPAGDLKGVTEAFQRGDMPLTLKRLRQARQQQPDLPPAEVVLAKMFFSEEQAANGHQMLEQAAVEHPRDPEPHLLFADFAMRDGRISDAQVQYEKAGKLATSFDGPEGRKQQLMVRAIMGLATIAERRGQYEVACQRCEAALKVDPNDAHAHFRLGNVLFYLDNADQAIVELRRAAELEPSSPSPLFTMVGLCRQTGKLDEAEKWLNEAVQQSPNDPQPLVAMARWQLEMRGAADEAERYVERARQMSPDSIDVALLTGLLAWKRDDLPAAEKQFEAAALSQPQNSTATMWLACVLAEQLDEGKGRAWALAQMAVTDTKQSPAAVATLGWVAFHLDKLQDAQRYLQVAVAAGAGRDASYYLARTSYRQGQMAHARAALEQALNGAGLFIHQEAAQQWKQELGSADN